MNGFATEQRFDELGHWLPNQICILDGADTFKHRAYTKTEAVWVNPLETGFLNDHLSFTFENYVPSQCK